MHILVLCQYHPPDLGGGSKRVSNAISGLRKLGHTIDVVTAFPHYPHGKVPTKYRRKIMSVENGLHGRIIRVWVPSIAHAGFSRRLIMYMIFSLTALFALPLVRKPDVVWSANPNVFSSFPAIIFSLYARAPIVRNVDDLWPETALQLGVMNRWLARFGEALAKLSYVLNKAITPISRAYCGVLIKKYNVSPSKLHVVEVGADTDSFIVQEKVTETKNEKFTVMYSGILGVGYDFDTVLQAAKNLQNEEIHFLIRGSGELETRIRSEIFKEELSNVSISNVYLEQKDLADLLTSADALLLPMKPDDISDLGVPTKLIEYMACGVPVICSSTGESARIIERARCGVVVPPGDASALASAISELSKNDARTKLGLNGRKYVEENLALDKIAIKLERAFLQALSDKARF